MYKKLRKIPAYLLCKFIILSGLLSLRVKYILKNNILLPIYFHNPDKKLFEDTIVWLKRNGFKFLSFTEFLDVIKKEKKIKGGVFISFDDGYEDNIINVLPVLNKYNVPATFFIPAKCIEQGFFWWDLFKGSYKISSIEQNLFWKIPNSQRVDKVNKLKSLDFPFPKRAITIKSLKNWQ